MSINPLLESTSFRLPGETVKLPSLALFYDNTVVDDTVLVEGEVYVQPMTTYEELLMKTPELIYSGQALTQVFGKCIPQIKQPMQLLAKDVDFLLIALRKISLGSVVTITHTHTCDDAHEHNYNVDVSSFIKDTNNVDPSTVTTLFEATLDNGQSVKLKPYTMGAVLSLSQTAVAQQDKLEAMSELELVNYMRDSILLNILPAIVSVGDVTDENHILEWLNNLPMAWIKRLNATIENTNAWGVDFTTEQVCKDCGESFTTIVPLNPLSFFTEPSGLEM
jgi:hypothetical protein